MLTRGFACSITVAGSRYHSFLDMGHSVRGPQRKRRYAHTPAPYTKPLPPLPSRSKLAWLLGGSGGY